MRPPGSTKTAVYQWQNSLTSITEQLGMIYFYQRVVSFNSNRNYCMPVKMKDSCGEGRNLYYAPYYSFRFSRRLISFSSFLDEIHKKYHGILRVNFDKVVNDCEEELTRVKVIRKNRFLSITLNRVLYHNQDQLKIFVNYVCKFFAIFGLKLSLRTSRTVLFHISCFYSINFTCHNFLQTLLFNEAVCTEDEIEIVSSKITFSYKS